MHRSRPISPATFSTLARSNRARALVAAALLLATWSCGDDSSAPVVPEPASIRLDASGLDFVAIGEHRVVIATVLDQEGGAMGGVPLSWSSDDASVASASDRGEVVAVGNGTTTIRVRTGSIEAELPVGVAQVVASVAVLPDSVVLGDPGDTLSVPVEAFDAGGAPIEAVVFAWTSSDTTVVAVTAGGAVEAR
jgi:hypothetical protein